MDSLIASPWLPLVLFIAAITLFVVVPMWQIIRGEAKKGRRISMLPRSRRSDSTD